MLTNGSVPAFMYPFWEKAIFNRRIFGPMTVRFTFLTALLITATYLAKAQTAPAAVTDEELVRYAVATDSLKKLTEQFNQASIKANHDPKIAAARQQQLAQTQGDSLKLVQIKATPYEKAYLKKVRDQRYRESARFRNNYSALINDYVGTDAYTKISVQLRNDPKLRHRLDSVTATLNKKKP